MRWCGEMVIGDGAKRRCYKTVLEGFKEPTQRCDPLGGELLMRSKIPLRVRSLLRVRSVFG